MAESDAFEIPHAQPETERAFLGCLILDARQIEAAIDRIPGSALAAAAQPPADRFGRPLPYEPLFFSLAHEQVFGSIIRLRELNQEICLQLVAEELAAHKQLELIGGLPYLTTFEDDIFATTMAAQLADNIVGYWRKRSHIRFAQKFIKAAAESNGSFDLVYAEYLEATQNVEMESGSNRELPAQTNLMNLPTFNDQSLDPNELIRHRFICRGSVNTFIGPTGIGKSSCMMQMAVLLALGREAFGLEPVAPLKTLIIQAENDAGDMGEMRDGVIAGMKLAASEVEAINQSITIYTISTVTSDAFGALLARLVDRDKPDLVIIDPALAYIGDDVLKQAAVSHFMRDILIPTAQRFMVAIILAHHTNKPPQGKEKGTWTGSELSYIGSGSSEWANASRAIMGLRSLGSSKVFEFIVPKRGGRLRWVEEDGQTPAFSRYIAWSKTPNEICWRSASLAEAREAIQKAKQDALDALDPLGTSKWSDVIVAVRERKGSLRYKDLQQLIMDLRAYKTPGAADKIVKKMREAGEFLDPAGTGFYRLDPKYDAAPASAQGRQEPVESYNQDDMIPY